MLWKLCQESEENLRRVYVYNNKRNQTGRVGDVAETLAKRCGESARN